MKHHIIFKFIAVLLCAASLAGAVGSILGIAVLASVGLYDQSVEEMLSARISQDSAELADWLAKNYASTELGGASDALVQSRYGKHWFTTKYNPSFYGYTISDAEGSELLSFHPELRDLEGLLAKEAFPITGTYLHVVSAESLEEQDQRHEAEREELLGGDVMLDSVNEIPAEGAVVESLIFADAGGQPILEVWYNGTDIVAARHTQAHTDNAVIGEEALGFLFYSPQGNLIFHSAFDYRTHVGLLEEQEIYEAYFTFGDSQIRLFQEEAVGRIYLNDQGHLMFLSQPMAPAQAAEEGSDPEATETTVPETTAETLPPETEPEETEASEEEEEDWEEQESSEEEEVYSDASAVPVEGHEETHDGSGEETEIPETITVLDKPLNEYQINTQTYYDPQRNTTMTAEFVYVSLPEITVEIYMTPDALRYGNGYEALALLRQFRDLLIPVAAACLLVFAIFGVYLCTAAGRTPHNEDIAAGGPNRMPLDLYLLGGSLAAACLVIYGKDLFLGILDQDLRTACGILAALDGLVCLLVVGFCFAFVAQLKTPGGFWWRNTFCGHCLRLGSRLILWLKNRLTGSVFPFFGWILYTLWQYTMVAIVRLYHILEKVTGRLGCGLNRLGRLLWQMLHRSLKLLPITWQWMLSGVVIIFCCVLAFRTYNAFATLTCLLIPVAIILYGAHCYGTLAEGARRMSKGDLATQVDDSLMVGCFKDSAADLNALADVAAMAARDPRRPEDSPKIPQDLMTSLTAILSYVELLRHPHSEDEGELYLEVLERQSQQLKTRLEELMEQSNGHTGSLQAEITTTDAVETVTQAMEAFSGQLDRAGLTPVFRHTQAQMPMRADSRLVHRVLNNLLHNAVQYSMPGTRLYVDLTEAEGTVVLSLKNISREELCFTSEELMSRFAGGDVSRNPEGIGLGLNIARNLMELQNGQLHLQTDGDLFKVTLVFPAADV